jgi:sporulation protein YlmC with PRC-barrel domain
MAERNATSLIKLSDSDHMLANALEDIRGLKVRDSDGEDLGTVDDLLIDTDDHKVRMMRVEHGGILGIGAQALFIPVDAITGIADDAVQVGETRSRVAEAPQYDPKVIEEKEFYASLYEHYGYPPYWNAR